MRAGPLIVLLLTLSGCAAQSQGFGPMPPPNASGLDRIVRQNDERQDAVRSLRGRERLEAIDRARRERSRHIEETHHERR